MIDSDSEKSCSSSDEDIDHLLTFDANSPHMKLKGLGLLGSKIDRIKQDEKVLNKRLLNGIFRKKRLD